MGYGRLLQMGERNSSQVHGGNSSQMLVGVGKEQVCQNPELQMGLWAQRRGNATTQMCGDCISQPMSLRQEEPRNLRLVGPLPPPAAQPLLCLPCQPGLFILKQLQTLGPAASLSKLLQHPLCALRGELRGKHYDRTSTTPS